MAINDYLTVTEFKASMPDYKWNTSTYDTLITSLITASSRSIDRFVNRKPGAFKVTTDIVRYFDGPGYGEFTPVYGFRTARLTSGYTGVIVLPISEIADWPTEVAVAETGAIATGNGANAGQYTVYPATDYYMEPMNALDNSNPFDRITLDIVNGTHRFWYPFKKGIRVTGKFGYSTTVPDDVKQVVTEQTIRWFKLAEKNYQDYGNVGSLPLGDTQFFGERFRNIEADLQNLVMHYRVIPV